MFNLRGRTTSYSTQHSVALMDVDNNTWMDMRLKHCSKLNCTCMVSWLVEGAFVSLYLRLSISFVSISTFMTGLRGCSAVCCGSICLRVTLTAPLHTALLHTLPSTLLLSSLDNVWRGGIHTFRVYSKCYGYVCRFLLTGTNTPYRL